MVALLRLGQRVTSIGVGEISLRNEAHCSEQAATRNTLLPPLLTPSAATAPRLKPSIDVLSGEWDGASTLSRFWNRLQ
jgi:hypothetical protein